ARILEEMGVREPPVPDSFIYYIDPARTVRVVVEPLRRGTRGATMLSPDGAEWWVVLNANDRYPVRRFTLAHEAFHIACGTGLAMRRDGMGRFYECSLADHFASHLLIPRGWLASLVGHSAAGVARRCGVSLSAASVRLHARRSLPERP
ncbi:MAG: ImmA/IrrE family metallo-endopeptidase, partial [Hyphomicrobiales bacterium]